MAMDPNEEILHESLPFFRIYKSGRVDRYYATDFVSASVDSATGVATKDIVIRPETGVSARLYLPNQRNATRYEGTHALLPLYVYFHAGGFCIGSAFNPITHNNLNSLVARANIIAVSVEYRLAPEHRIPAAYDDSATVIQWLASHSEDGGGPEEWLNENADFRRVFLGGDSSGANIAHRMAICREVGWKRRMRIRGLVLVQPYFLGTTVVESEEEDPATAEKMRKLWEVACGGERELDDERVNPVAEGAPGLEGLRCERVLVCLAEKDVLRDRGRVYYERLVGSGWPGAAEVWVAEGERHAFHLAKPGCETAVMQEQVISRFLNCD